MNSKIYCRNGNRIAKRNSWELLKKRVFNLKNELRPIEFFLDELPDFVPKQEQGWTDGGLCPFHADRRAGSFKVNLDSGAFRCFSCGASGGDILAFYQMVYKCNFLTTVSDLEERIQ